MNNSFFTQFRFQSQHHENNILKDLLRLLRDMIAVVNDVLNLEVIGEVVDYLNQIIGDTQSNDTHFHP